MTSSSDVATAVADPSFPRAPKGDPARLDLPARRWAGVLLLLIAVVVAIIVFWPGPPDPGGQSALHRYLEGAHANGLPGWITFDLIQNLANVAMFLPVGYLGSLAMRRHNYLIVAYAALASSFIELTQLLLLPNRVASLQDIAANTIGALIGFLLSLPALRRRGRRRRRYAQGRRAASDTPRQAARAARL